MNVTGPRNYVTYMANYLADSCFSNPTRVSDRMVTIPQPSPGDAAFYQTDDTLWYITHTLFTVVFKMDKMDCVMGLPGFNPNTAGAFSVASKMWKCVDDPSGASCAVTGATGVSDWYTAYKTAIDNGSVYVSQPQDKWIPSALACDTATAPSKLDTRTAWHDGSCCDTSSNCSFAHKVDYVKQDGTSVSEELE